MFALFVLVVRTVVGLVGFAVKLAVALFSLLWALVKLAAGGISLIAAKAADRRKACSLNVA